ncbi:DinB family protein [Bacillus pakistanensis]|uniref:DinB family protein n=1 Tax=Rossellomorea pakistanensis TaxID=992288 RepID=UPI003083EE31
MNIASQLEGIIQVVPKKVLSLTDIDYKPRPSKWSKKEILGHLCDSANINHKRFVEILISKEPIVISGYNQDLWVQVHQYHSKFSVEEILNIWTSLNTQIIYLLSAITDEQLELQCKTEEQKAVTLEWLVTDYLDHMNHHLKQIIGK